MPHITSRPNFNMSLLKVRVDSFLSFKMGKTSCQISLQRKNLFTKEIHMQKKKKTTKKNSRLKEKFYFK